MRLSEAIRVAHSTAELGVKARTISNRNRDLSILHVHESYSQYRNIDEENLKFFLHLSSWYPDLFFKVNSCFATICQILG